MALQTSGQISLNDIHLELGATTGTQVSLNDADVRGLIGKASGAQNAMNEYYGAADETEAVNEGNINGQPNIKQARVSDYISSGETFVIPSGFWCWSDLPNAGGLIIDIPCTIKNYGYIIGKGGTGGRGSTSSNNQGNDGGMAIEVEPNAGTVNIINYSGAYIAGGGGGGAGGYGTGGASYGSGAAAGGGGGAGGGNGNYGSNWNYTSGTTSTSGGTLPAHTIGDGTGGILNASGENGSVNAHSLGNPADDLGFGGQAGGTGGTYNITTSNPQYCGGGGGGGRILPGAQRNRDNRDLQGQGGYGGGGNNAGGDSAGTRASQAGGGGGGWGAAGGDSSATVLGGSAGPYLTNQSVATNTVTVTNSGTIYGPLQTF
jgi:hypothetical protein